MTETIKEETPVEKEVSKDNQDLYRLKLVYLALLSGAMAYKEGIWRKEVDNYNILLANQGEELSKKNNATFTKDRKLLNKIKAMSLDFEQKQTLFNTRAYAEIAEVKAQFNVKDNEAFDSYSDGFGLIIGEYVTAKNTAELLRVCQAYNAGLLDNLLEILKEVKPEVEPPATDEKIEFVKAKDEDSIFKCKCGKDVDGDLHPCPYSEEINNDSESECNCCSDCIHECGMDI